VTEPDQWYEEPPKRSPTFLIVLGVLLLLLVALLVVFAKNLGVGGSTDQVAVPTVVGLPQDQATAKLTDAGFTVVPKQELEAGKAQGIVLRQDPDGGTKIDKGGSVTIVVNSGEAPVDVPDLVGKTDAEADKVLRDLGLVATYVSEPNDEKPEGEILAQDPEPGGDPVPKGSTITLTRSSGAGEAEVPDVAGKSPTEAANILGRAGFETTTTDEESGTVPKGQVVRTDPPAGDQLQKGQQVTIYVSTGPSTVTVPSVLDLSAAQATSKLRAAGFNVTTVQRTTIDPEEDGLVLAQSPEGDTDAAAGSTVTIYVGKLIATTSTSTTSSTTTTTTTP
jgi:serine/threonine-protein kinase